MNKSCEIRHLKVYNSMFKSDIVTVNPLFSVYTIDIKTNTELKKRKGQKAMSAYMINKNNFKQEVLGENGTVVIDFFAPWCMPCKMFSPVVDKIAEEYKGSVKVGKINIDEEPELAQEFGVMSIPTLIVMRDGKVLNRSVGLKSKKEIEKMIQA